MNVADALPIADRAKVLVLGRCRSCGGPALRRTTYCGPGGCLGTDGMIGAEDRRERAALKQANARYLRALRAAPWGRW
jgi:hypothetical protein